MDTKAPAYEGDEPFTFVCYAHEDSTLVYAELDHLRSQNINVWYDAGISVGSEWTQDIADALHQCEVVLFFVSQASANSRHCRNEIQYALDLNKRLVTVYLEPAELPGGLALTIGGTQALMRYSLSESAYREKLHNALTSRSNPSSLTRFNPPSPRRRRGASRALIGSLLVVLGIAAWLAFGPVKVDSTDSAGGIAVLPFEYRGPDSTEAYLAAGLADELSIALAQSEQLSVAPRMTVAYFADRQTPPEEIAQALGVRYILEGKILRTASTFRINLQMIDAALGKAIWNQTYQANSEDIFGIQSNVVAAVLRTLLPNEAQPAVTLLPTESSVAYDHYLKGRALLRQGEINAYERALAEFDAAIDADASFASAHAGRCETFITRYWQGRSQADFANAESACFRALTLQRSDQPSWQVHTALGELYHAAGQNEKAIASLNLANQLHANSPSVLRYLGEAYAGAKKFADAEAALKQAIALDPTFWDARITLASTYYKQSRYAESAAELQQVLDIAPDYGPALIGLGSALYMLGEPKAAYTAWVKAEDMIKPVERSSLALLHSNLGLAYYYDGDFGAAAASQEQAAKLAPLDHRIWGRWAESLRHKGDHEQAQVRYTKAIELARDALKINPTHWEHLGLLGLYLAFSGDAEAAKKYSTKMLSVAPGNATAHYFDALSSWGSGDPDNAFDSLSKAIRLGFALTMLKEDPDLNRLQSAYPDRFAALMRAGDQD